MTGMQRNVPAEQMIAALIPAPLPRPRPAPPPLPRLPAPPAPSKRGEPELDVARLDPSGRVSAHALLHRLGWHPGHRVRFDVADQTVMATSDHAGRYVVGARGQLAIPVAARQLCGITPGEVVVLVADLDRKRLVLHPAHAVARLLVQRCRGEHGS